MKIFVTNLPWSHERRAHIKGQLDRIEADYEFVTCVIGKDLTDEEIGSKCDLEELRQLNANSEWLNKGMIGCSLTSQNVHHEIASRDMESGMLLEDDAVIPNNLLKILAECEAVIQPGDVVLLYWVGWNQILLRGETEIKLPSISLFEPANPEDIGGGTATIFSKEAAKGLLAVNSPVRITPDCWNDLKNMGGFNRLLCAFPLPVTTADFMSTMELGRFVWARRAINKYRIFPLYQILKYKRRAFRMKMTTGRII